MDALIGRDLITLQKNQLDISPFRDKCSVYIFSNCGKDRNRHAQVIGSGRVGRSFFKFNGAACVILHEVYVNSSPLSNKAPKRELLTADNLRYTNGCNVYVKQATDDDAKRNITREGVVLGFCDIPINDGRRKYTKDNFWYSVQILDESGGECCEIINEISPTQLSFRSSKQDDIIKIEDDDVIERPVEFIHIRDNAKCNDGNDRESVDEGVNNIVNKQLDAGCPSALSPKNNRELLSSQSSCIPIESNRIEEDKGACLKEKVLDKRKENRPTSRTHQEDNFDNSKCNDGNDRESVDEGVERVVNKQLNAEFPSTLSSKKNKELLSSQSSCILIESNRIEEDKGACVKEKILDKRKENRSISRTHQEDNINFKNTARTSKISGSSSAILFLGNLSNDTGQTSIKNFFLTVGEVIDVDIRLDKNGHSKGYAFVTLSQEDAHTSLGELKGKKLDGNYIRMSYKKWWTIAPRESEAHVQIRDGKKYHWCMKGNEGQGLWKQHLERDHEEDKLQSHHNIAKVKGTPSRKRALDENVPSQIHQRDHLGVNNTASEIVAREIKRSRLSHGDRECGRESRGSSAPQVWKENSPRLPESYTKYFDDETYHWCRKCKNGNGKWVAHTEEEHNGNQRPRNTSATKKRFSSIVENPYVDRSIFDRFLDSARYYSLKEAKQLMRGELPASKWNPSIPVCLSYHLRGRCSSTCKSAEDHRPMNKDEARKISDWFDRKCCRLESSPSDQKTWDESHGYYIDSDSDEGDNMKSWQLKLYTRSVADAKPFIVGPLGRAHSELLKRTGCKVINLYPLGKFGCRVKATDPDGIRARNCCYHVLKILRKGLKCALVDFTVESSL